MISHLGSCAFTLVLIPAVACQVEGEPATSGPSLAAKAQAAQARMHARFESARRIELAIVHSDLDKARVEAHFLGRLDEPDMLPQWRPYLDRIWAAARRIELAPDVVEAAKATAVLGRECGRCHQALAAKIAFPVEARPADDRRLQQQMLGHQWASARMWDGLIGASDDSWVTGSRALTQVSLTIVAEEPMTITLRDSGGHIGDDIARVRLYANRALTAQDQDARAEIFGDLLATCARCHATIRDR